MLAYSFLILPLVFPTLYTVLRISSLKHLVVIVLLRSLSFHVVACGIKNEPTQLLPLQASQDSHPCLTVPQCSSIDIQLTLPLCCFPYLSASAFLEDIRWVS